MDLRLPCSLFLLAFCLLLPVQGSVPGTVARKYANPAKTPDCDHSAPPTPVVSPTPSPTTPSPPPTPSGSPRSHLGYCVPQCQQRCKKYQRRIRVCVRVCTQCCEKNNRCVPSDYETCPNWNTVIYHGIQTKCP